MTLALDIVVNDKPVGYAYWGQRLEDFPKLIEPFFSDNEENEFWVYAPYYPYGSYYFTPRSEPRYDAPIFKS